MRNGTTAGTRVDRQRAIRELITRMPIGSQGELATQLGPARLRRDPGHRLA